MPPAAPAAPGPGMPRRGELHPGVRPPLDDLGVPVHGEPVDQRVGDDPADAVDGGQFVSGCGADGVERAEVVGQGAGGDRLRRGGC